MKTDTQLQQDVIAELKWQPSIEATQIGVSVNDGVVTLSGEVGSYVQKWAAEKAAQRVTGVSALAVDLKVNLFGLGKRTDIDIARAVENGLEWSASVPEGIKTMVENGWVTLSGVAHWQFQKEAAADSVRGLLGVTGVSNDIDIKPKVSASAVQKDIEAALKRSAVKDAEKIKVAVDGAEVTLSGKVHSWAERETATDSAWASPGVLNVTDKMAMTY